MSQGILTESLRAGKAEEKIEFRDAEISLRNIRLFFTVAAFPWDIIALFGILFQESSHISFCAV